MRLLQVCWFALPWLCLPGTDNPYLAPREVALLGTMGMLTCWSLFRLPLATTTPPNRWLGWSAIYVFLMGLWHFYWPLVQKAPGMTTITYNVYTWIPTIHVLLFLLTVRTLSLGYLRLAVQGQVLAQWCCWSAALCASYALCQAVGLDQWYVVGGGGHSYHSVSGSFGNPEHLSLFLACVLPLCGIFKAKRYLCIGVLLLSVIGLSRVQGTWLIAAIGIISYLLSRWQASLRRWMWLALLAVVLALAWCLWHSLWAWLRHNERWGLWQTAWGLLRFIDPSGSPRLAPAITGYGLGAVAILCKSIWVHNEWLQALVEFGVIGTLLLGLSVWSTTKRVWQRAAVSILDAGWCGVWMALLAASVAFPVGHWPHLAMLLMVVWAVIEREEWNHA